MNIPVEIELDKYDKVAHQIIAYADEIPAGTARWRKTKEGMKLERFAVLPKFRLFGIGKALAEYILKTLKNEPLLAATFLGLIFLATKSQTPIFFTSTLELIGQLAIPLMLITLGVAVANLNSTHLYKALKLSILKLIICLSLSILIGNILALDQIPFYILVLQMSAPVAITSYLIAKKYDADDKAVAGIVITSTIISTIYFPIICSFETRMV